MQPLIQDALLSMLHVYEQCGSGGRWHSKLRISP